MGHRAERRLAAILAADVVGYSRLMAADEAGTHARLRTLRQDFIEPTIAGHRGRVVTLLGDGALVEFPSVVDAVECAAEIQRGVAERQAQVPEECRIAFRIGINIGDVISEDREIYGDGVNVAARLEQLAEPGGVWVARNVYDQVKAKVAFAFEPLGDRRVKNIPEPVAVYRLLRDPGPVTRTPGFGGAGARRRRLALLAAALALLVSAGVTAWLRPSVPGFAPATEARAPTPLPAGPSIAVLPFDNLSDDPEQAYFSDGITEDLITDLSKVAGLFVIARDSSFRFKDRVVEPQEVARALGVRYLLEGSVRRTGERLRINARLLDATTGGQLWAERYDGAPADVFELQDEVTRQIVEALAANLTVGVQGRAGRGETANPEAYDAFLKGLQHYRQRTPEHYVSALRYFERAAALDPRYARAFAAIAAVYWRSGWEGWFPTLGLGSWSEGEWLERAEEHLGIALAEPTPLAHQVAAHLKLWRGRYDEAIAEAERAVALDANDADSRAVLAEVLIYSGEPEEALAPIDAARRLDPYNEGYYSLLEGFARFSMEQFDGAAVLLERALELSPGLWPAQAASREAWCYPCALLLAAYGHAGREEEVRALRERLSGYLAAMTIRGELRYWPFKDRPDVQRLAEGLRRAGLPEY